MAEDKIKKDDISVVDPMGYITDSAKKASIEVDKLAKDLGILLPLTEKIFKGKPNNVNDIQLQERALKKLNDEADRARKIEESATKQKIQLERLAQAEIRTKNLVTAQINKETAATEKLTRAQQRAESGYFKIQDKLTKTSNAYRELAIRKELMNNLTAKEELQYATLQKRLVAYDGVLKKVDAQMGRHQRNVGNYSYAYNGLGFSMAQLTREAPAFANSVQTGFMALSNNIPIFIDEITKLKTSGESTGGVLKKIGASLFSLQTALSVGVTLLTIYGAQMVEFFSTLGGVNQEFKNQSDVLDAVNDKMAENAEGIAKERAELEILLNVAKDENEEKELRLKAIDKLNKINPFYQNTLTLETINTKEATKATAEYISMIEKKARVQAATSLLEEVYKKQINLQINGSSDFDLATGSIEGLLAFTASIGDKEAEAKRTRIKVKNFNKEMSSLEKDAQEILNFIGGLDPNADALGLSEEKDKKDKKGKESDKFKSIEQWYALRKKMILEEGNTIRQEATLIRELDKERLVKKIALEKATKGELIDITNLEIELIELSRQSLDFKREEMVILEKTIKLAEKRKDIDPTNLVELNNLAETRNQQQAEYNILLKELELVQAQNRGASPKELMKLEKELIELKKKQIDAQLELEKKQAGSDQSKIQTLEKQAELEKAKLDASQKQVDVQKELTTITKEVFEITKDYLTNVLEAQVKSIDEQIEMVKKSYSLLEKQAENGNIKANESIKEQMRLELELIEIREKKARQIAFINGLSSLGSSFAGGAGSQSLGNIFASLQGFETGTETEIGNYVKPNLKGIGKDDIAVRVHAKERIINEGLAKKIQGHKTSDVINGYVQYHQMMANNMIGGQTIDLTETNHLLKKQLDQKPTEYNLEKVVGSAFDIIRTERKGNSIEKRVRRVRL